MAAAPHLFDDSLVASPELALVDMELAAQLRDDIRTGAEFRPRTVARPEFRHLRPVELGEDEALVGEAAELPESVVPREETVLDVEPVVVALDAPATPPVVAEHSELPDYVVVHEELPDEDVGSSTAFLDVVLDPPVTDEVSELPDYVVLADDLGTADPSTASDYPELPDLGEASVALEETDEALRKIREQLASEQAMRRRKLRTGFIAASGLGVVAALAVYAVDVQQGVATLPSWLGY